MQVKRVVKLEDDELWQTCFLTCRKPYIERSEGSMMKRTPSDRAPV